MSASRFMSRLGLLTLAFSALLAVQAFAAPVKVAPGTAASAQFPPSTSCRCHGQLVSEWQKSLHSKALSDPLFKVKVAEAEKAAGKEIGVFCRRCHGPVANMSKEDGGPMSPVSAEGITCSFCHQITGAKTPLGNVSQLVEPNGVMRAQIQDPKSPHNPAYSEFHTTSDICGGCHNVNHPINGMHLESTYAEWKKSPQAKQGTQCQDCHMSETPPLVGPSTGQAATNAPQRDNIYHMTFAGAQVALGDAGRATALLKSAAKVDVVAPEILAGTTAPKVEVTVTNVGAGHKLPTGLTEVRQMWLVVVATDETGKETELGRHVYGTELKDAKGNSPVELWEAVGIAKDDRIAPGGSSKDSYEIALPAGVEAADITARLLYKSAPDELAKKAGVENPTTTMAEAVTRVFATEEAKAADAAKPKPTEEASASAAGSTSGSSSMPWIIGGIVLLAAGVLGAVIYFGDKRKRA
ncbi:MAG: hypothetical protein HGB10_01625 [Coriobacteriia bacterium]|nr:hypothetical protein [Coriobacteriia bacterium]